MRKVTHTPVFGVSNYYGNCSREATGIKFCKYTSPSDATNYGKSTAVDRILRANLARIGPQLVELIGALSSHNLCENRHLVHT